MVMNDLIIHLRDIRDINIAIHDILVIHLLSLLKILQPSTFSCWNLIFFCNVHRDVPGE